jgi:hypothetical protein
MALGVRLRERPFDPFLTTDHRPAPQTTIALVSKSE